MKIVRVLSAVLIFVPFIFVGCGGGDGSSPNPQTGGTAMDIGSAGSTSGGTGGETVNTGASDTAGTSGGTVNTGTGITPRGTVDTAPGTGGGSTGTAAGVITLAWDAAPSPAAGYKIYFGTASGTYGSPVNVRGMTTYTLAGLTKGRTYYIAATSYDAAGNESNFSDEVNGTAK